MLLVYQYHDYMHLYMVMYTNLHDHLYRKLENFHKKLINCTKINTKKCKTKSKKNTKNKKRVVYLYMRPILIAKLNAIYE